MKIYELKDGTPVRQIQKAYKVNVFEREIEDITYDTKIITDGLIESKSVQDEKYNDFSGIDILRTTNLYLKNYTYAIVLYIGHEAFCNGKAGGVIDCIKNISIYLRNLNDKEALKTAKKVIKQIRQANSEYKDFSMNSLLREENKDFIFNVLDENVYFAKKLINEKTKKYRVSDLYLISAKGKERINYFLCTYNPLYNCYIEVLTNNIIEPDSDIEENYLPSILNELNIKISLHKKLNYYELIYLYDKIRNISVPNLEDKHNLIDSGKKVMFKNKT
mgnify:CR=1 FL=1